MSTLTPATADACAAHLLRVLHTAGQGAMWAALAAELRAALAPLPPASRYQAGLDWLDRVHQQLGAEGVELSPLPFLRVLIGAGGDRLDQTVFLTSGGLQQVTLN